MTTEGEAGWDGWGSSVCAGDFNADGQDDLAGSVTLGSTVGIHAFLGPMSGPSTVEDSHAHLGVEVLEVSCVQRADVTWDIVGADLDALHLVPGSSTLHVIMGFSIPGDSILPELDGAPDGAAKLTSSSTLLLTSYSGCASPRSLFPRPSTGGMNGNFKTSLICLVQTWATPLTVTATSSRSNATPPSSRAPVSSALSRSSTASTPSRA